MLRILTWCAKCLFLYIVVAVLAYKLAWIFVQPVWAVAVKTHLTTQSKNLFSLNYFLPVFAISGFLIGLAPFHRLSKAFNELAPDAQPLSNTIPAIYFAWVPVTFAFLIRFFSWHSSNSSVLGGNDTSGRAARFFGNFNVQTRALLDSMWIKDRFFFTGPMLFLMAAALAALLRRSLFRKPKSSTPEEAL
jgi:hypothetical protein